MYLAPKCEMKVVKVSVSSVCLPAFNDSCLAVSALNRQLEETVFGAALCYYGEVGNRDIERHEV